MHIRIELDERDPPAGRVCVEGGQQREFVGWLGLMGEMAALLDAEGTVGSEGELGLDADGSAGSAGDLGGERHP